MGNLPYIEMLNIKTKALALFLLYGLPQKPLLNAEIILFIISQHLRLLKVIRLTSLALQKRRTHLSVSQGYKRIVKVGNNR